MNTKLLRQKILDLAIRGKLTEQKKSDGTTKDLLAQIQDERRETNDESDAGKKGSSNVILERTSNVILERTSNVILERTSNVILERTSNVIASEAKQSKKSKPAEPKTIIPLNKDEAPFEIPENWEWVRLGDLMEKVGAGSTPTGGKKIYGTSGIKFIRSQNVHNDGLRLDDVAYIDPKIHEQKMHSQVVANDLLLNITGASIGRCAIVPNDFDVANINQHVLILRLLEKEMLGYVHTVVISNFVFSQIMSAQVGGTKEGLSAERAKALEIPLPPLAEQQRIVAAIESAFAEITAIENNQELLKKHIKQGRQKILDLAIRGKLTEQKKSDGTTKDLLTQIQDERRETNDESDAGKKGSSNVILERTSNVILERTSNVILERTSNVILERTSNVIASEAKQSKKSKPAEPKTIIPLDKNEAPFEIPETWEWVRLGDVCIFFNGYAFDSKEFKDDGTPIIRISNIADSKIDLSKCVFSSEMLSESFVVSKGDLLIAMSGATTGKMGVYDKDDKAYLNQRVGNIKVKDNNILVAGYRNYYLNSQTDNILAQAYGGAQPNISSKAICEMYIPLPPLAEQQRIVAAIESAFAEFDAMEKL